MPTELLNMHMKIAILSALFAMVAAAPQQQFVNTPSTSSIPIVAFVQDQNPYGFYRYDTGDGIAVEAQADFPVQGDGPAPAQQGSYVYTGPDDIHYQVAYVADSNGFQARDAHLPTLSPIPPELALAIANPPVDEDVLDQKNFPTQKTFAVEQ